MKRSVRPWGLALAGSLLLHLVLFGGLKDLLPRWDSPPEPPPFEVQLVAVPKPVVPVAPAKQALPAREPPVHPTVKPAAARPVEPVVAEANEPEPEPQPEPMDIPVAVDESIPIDADVPPTEAAPPGQTAPTEVAVPPLNPLPPRLDLRFRLRYGIAEGEQTIVWIDEGERYTLTSVASATGLAGIFYRGRFVQTSRGRITPYGLQPEEFWDQRGNKRSSARFDPALGQLTLLPSSGAPRHFAYQGDAQDALSLFLQLALTAPPPDGHFSYTVFNGKKLREYTYEVRGEVMLDTALGTLRTLHLARRMNSEGRFEVWLAIDRYYLPVRMLRSEENGDEMELSVRSIAP